jgi:hypothetical protein
MSQTAQSFLSHMRDDDPMIQIENLQANQIGCRIITVTHDLLKKLALVGKNLNEFSLDTVKMFPTDAVKARPTLQSSQSTSGKADAIAGFSF